MREHNSLSDAQLEVRFDVEHAFGKKNPPRSDEIINTEFIESIRIRDFLMVGLGGILHSKSCALTILGTAQHVFRLCHQKAETIISRCICCLL